YRAFFAIPPLTNSQGFPTNAIYGFTNMLLQVLREQEAEYVAVVFDAPGPTFRHEAFGEYKANRPSMPEDLRPQIPYIKGFEADDIIGTLARNAEHEGTLAFLVSADKDFMQLVSSQVTLYDPMKEKKFGIPEVVERFGVPPEKVIEVMGLSGDTSDNIPGVPGIGEKTAARLIEEFGSIEKLLARVDEVKSPKIRENLIQYGQQARLSRELVTLDTLAPIAWELEELKKGAPEQEKLLQIFQEMQFGRLLKEFALQPAKGGEDYLLVLDDRSFSELVTNLKKAGTFALDLVQE
ncbi:MAG: DNA polymerase I, partial [Deltaproteobacteria bacterium]|nr:DNA polymerase I [Deltaproteobacteria bacterium]